jgi:hypothetical protein
MPYANYYQPYDFRDLEPKVSSDSRRYDSHSNDWDILRSRTDGRERSRSRHHYGKRTAKQPYDNDPSLSSDASDSDDGRHFRCGKVYSSHRHRYRKERLSSRSHSRSRDKKLRPEDVMLYDPDTTSVTVFIKRIKQIRNLHGEKAILKVLPLCLRGKALTWYTHLSDDATEEMQFSLQSWIQHLERRFKRNPLDARREAEKLVFRYATENDLPLREFIEKKIMLLQEAGNSNESDIEEATSSSDNENMKQEKYAQDSDPLLICLSSNSSSKN